MRERLPRRWVLAPGSRSCAERVAGLFNWSYERDEPIDLDLAACGFPGDQPVLVFDFWARQLLGVHRGRVSALLPPAAAASCS